MSLRRTIEKNLFTTGWWGIPGGPVTRSTRTHVYVNTTGEPLCGSRMSPEQRFQWSSAGIRDDWIECKRCQAKISKVREYLSYLESLVVKP